MDLPNTLVPLYYAFMAYWATLYQIDKGDSGFMLT